MYELGRSKNKFETSTSLSVSACVSAAEDLSRLPVNRRVVARQQKNFVASLATGEIFRRGFSLSDAYRVFVLFRWMRTKHDGKDD